MSLFDPFPAITTPRLVHPDNLASIRVAEKLGFRKEAHFGENLCNGGVFEDTAVVSLLSPSR